MLILIEVSLSLGLSALDAFELAVTARISDHLLPQTSVA